MKQWIQIYIIHKIWHRHFLSNVVNTLDVNIASFPNKDMGKSMAHRLFLHNDKFDKYQANHLLNLFKEMKRFAVMFHPLLLKVIE